MPTKATLIEVIKAQVEETAELKVTTANVAVDVETIKTTLVEQLAVEKERVRVAQASVDRWVKLFGSSNIAWFATLVVYLIVKLATGSAADMPVLGGQ